MALRLARSSEGRKLTDEGSGSGSGEPSLSLFKDKSIDVISPREKVKGMLMPAFNYSLDIHDAAFKTSVSPYRYADNDPAAADVSEPEDYYRIATPVSGYTFFGKSKSTFMSCKMAMRNGAPIWGTDPIIQMRIHIYLARKAGNDELFNQLIGSRKKSDPNYFPSCSTLFLLNVWSGPTYEKAKVQDEANRVMVLKDLAWKDLVDQLETERSARQTRVIDQNWPDFKLGDPTKPSAPLVYTGVKKHIGTVDANCIQFSDQKCKDASDVVHGNPFTNAQLAQRVVLADDSTWYIPTYEEMVDMLVAIKDIPYNLITTCCGDMYDGVIPARKGTTYHDMGAEPEKKPAAKASAGLDTKTDNLRPASEFFEDDPDDNIPMGDDDEDDDASTPIDDNPPAFNHDLPEEVVEKLNDPAINPGRLGVVEWYEFTLKNLHKCDDDQLMVYLAVKNAIGK